MSPTTTRGARGFAARYAARTETIVRIVRWCPYNRLGPFGTESVIGFQVTQSGPSTGSWVPPIRLPLHGRPNDVASRHSIFGDASARAAAFGDRFGFGVTGTTPADSTVGGGSRTVRLGGSSTTTSVPGTPPLRKSAGGTIMAGTTMRAVARALRRRLHAFAAQARGGQPHRPVGREAAEAPSRRPPARRRPRRTTARPRRATPLRVANPSRKTAFADGSACPPASAGGRARPL